MSKQVLHIRIRNVFPPPAILFGFIFIILGVFIAFVEGHYAAILLILMGTFMALTYQGAYINTEKRTIKSYTRILGYPFGEWQSFVGYPFVTMMRKRQSYNSTDPFAGASKTFSFYAYDVCLLSLDRKQVIPIYSTRKKEHAKDKVAYFSEELNLEIISYAEMNQIIKAGIQQRNEAVRQARIRRMKRRNNSESH